MIFHSLSSSATAAASAFPSYSVSSFSTTGGGVRVPKLGPHKLILQQPPQRVGTDLLQLELSSCRVRGCIQRVAEQTLNRAYTQVSRA